MLQGLFVSSEFFIFPSKYRVKTEKKWVLWSKMKYKTTYPGDAKIFISKLVIDIWKQIRKWELV